MVALLDKLVDEFELRKVAAYKRLANLTSGDFFFGLLSRKDIYDITQGYFICTTCNECLPDKVKALPKMCEACHAKCD